MNNNNKFPSLCTTFLRLLLASIYLVNYQINAYLIYPSYFSELHIASDLKKEILAKKPIILNGDPTSWKIDLYDMIATTQGLKIKKTSFNNFMKNMPHLYLKNTGIIVTDFCVKHGRIFDFYEKEILKSLCKTTNHITFLADNLDTITFKDIDLIKEFPIYHFPKLSDRHVKKHIYEMINLYGYNDLMYLIDWNKYNVLSIQLEQLNILLFEVNEFLKNKLISSTMIDKLIKDMINTMIYRLDNSLFVY
jgi:hypothetical protein